MHRVVHIVASWFLKRRIDQVQRFSRYPHEIQRFQFQQLLLRAQHTAWGRQYGYGELPSVDEFRQRVPISNYEQLFPFIERMMAGEPDVLWPGRVRWFAKSSGTTNDKSKYIPVTPESLEECHYKAGQDMLAMYLHNKPDSKLFSGKSLSIGGSHTINQYNAHARYGDLSAVLLENLPKFYEFIRTPGKEVALMDTWEQKIEAMAREVIDEEVTAMAGVPTWTLVLINHMFKLRGIDSRNLLEIWPGLELYVHGGVNFDPYREQFEAIIPHEGMTYLNCYNASEGFFAVQDQLRADDMLLMLDYGVFYEFLPLEALGEDHPRTHTLDEVELDRNYAMVISTNGGLWRYLIGDTVTFTSLSPFKIRITGRTKHFINAFGEEVVVENAETAISEACRQTGAQVDDYTAAPIYLAGAKRGGHEWLIEFSRRPQDLGQFVRILDETLRAVNSDYDAKRQGDIALLAPRVQVLPNGTFHRWLKQRGKLGGQHKIPRLANHREYLEAILKLVPVEK